MKIGEAHKKAVNNWFVREFLKHNDDIILICCVEGWTLFTRSTMAQQYAENGNELTKNYISAIY